MSIQRFDDANQRLQYKSSHPTPLAASAAIRCTSLFLTLVLVSLAGCQGMNQPYSMHGLTRVPPPGTRPGYPTTDGYYGPNNATSAIQPIGTVVAHNQHGAPWNGQGGLPSTDLTANSMPQAGSAVAVAPASYSGGTQQFDAYGQPLLRSYPEAQASYPSQASYQGASYQGASYQGASYQGASYQGATTAGANTWSNGNSMNASMAGFTGSASGGITSSLSDGAGGEPALPSTGSIGTAGNGTGSALTYPDASNLDWN